MVLPASRLRQHQRQEQPFLQERPQRRRRGWAAVLVACGVCGVCFVRSPAAFLSGRGRATGDAHSDGATEAGADARAVTGALRREALAAVAVATSPLTSLQRPAFAEESLRLDQYGRPLMMDGSLAKAAGLSYDGVATFNGKPKVFIAGSTGELGRRVALDLLRSGYSCYLGIRDEGRALECSYANRKSPKYEMNIVMDAFIEGGREEILKEQLKDASVVIHLAGARYGFDILRPSIGLDDTGPERTDLNGTKALIDAAKAKGVKKFIYVSAVLTNARALGEEVYESDAFKKWNNFGNVLDCKHDAEEYLKSSGLDYTIIRPTPMTNDFPKDVGGISFQAPDTIRLQSGEVGNKISRDDVSLAILDAVFNPKASQKTVELVGVPKTPPAARDKWWDVQPAPAPAPA